MFTGAHSAFVTCAASRYGLSTGINPVRHGVKNATGNTGPAIAEKTPSLGTLLRDQGYVTKMIGKCTWDIKGVERPGTSQSPSWAVPWIVVLTVVV